MNPITEAKLNHGHVCELCKLHDPMIKNYAEDFELQTALRDYVEKTSGERINVGDIAHLCDSCYTKINDIHGREDDEE